MKKIIVVGLTAFTIAMAAVPTSVSAKTCNTANKNIVTILQNKKSCNKKSCKLANCNIKSCSNKKSCSVKKCWIINGTIGNLFPDVELPDNDTTVEDNITNDTTTSSYARQVVDLVNKERVKQGLSKLKIDTKVGKAAVVRAKEIQTSFSHTRPNGSSFSTALKEAGVNYRGSGENIAWGQKTPQQVVEAWLNSPSHRANILNKNFTTIGVGHVTNSSGTSYWVQLFTY